MSEYQLKWITGDLAVGYVPMSYADFKLIKAGGIDAIVNLCAEFCDLHEIEKQYNSNQLLPMEIIKEIWEENRKN